MPRQKKKKPRRQWSHREAPTPFETSLEEDLAKQRRRQQQRQLEAEKRKKLEPPQEQQQQQQQQLHEGLEIEFSQIHKRPVRPEDIIFKGLQTSTLDDLTGLSSLSLAYAQTQCSILSPYHRHRVRQVWQTKYLLELLHINPRASALYSHKFKWLDYSLPDGMHCSWDLTCKHFLHPSARTFDVALFSEGSPQQLPTIATAVQGGWGLFQPPRGRDHRVHTLRGRPVHAIRMHEKSAQCGTVVRSNDSYVPYVFQIYPLPHPTSYLEVPLFKPVHDFCFGTDLALFACPRFTGNETLTPLFLPLGRGDRELFTLNVRNFPQSDALRVEMECASNGKYIAFGHRNGQISLLDLRQSQTTTILQYHNGESFNVLGSAVDLGFLAQRNQLLVKRSFGTCQLHDLRMTTSTGSSMTRSSSSSSSVVHHLGVPSELINPTLSANCNGFAVDPTSEQTLMAPYISAQQEVHLGVWSLGTGVMVGSRRVLAKNTTDDVLYTEVCQRTTPSFSERKKSRKALASSSSTFGVWLKCGRFSKSKSNSRFGSLHHVNFASS